VKTLWAFWFGSRTLTLTPRYHYSSNLARWILPDSKGAFTFWRHVFIKRGVLPQLGMFHEQEHVDQFARLGVPRFCVLYVWYNIRKGYHDNPFEKAAREKASARFRAEFERRCGYGQANPMDDSGGDPARGGDGPGCR
jgi:hypothetical protein